MKLMKKILLTTIVSFFASIHFINGQDQNANLQKYWAYRDRLRQKFILVDQNVEHFGANIPASSIDLNGRSIFSGEFVGNEVRIDLGFIQNGMYLLTINCNGRTLTEKITILR